MKIYMLSILSLCSLVLANATLLADDSGSNPGLRDAFVVYGPTADELAEVIREAAVEADDEVTLQTTDEQLRISCQHTAFVPVCLVKSSAPTRRVENTIILDLSGVTASDLYDALSVPVNNGGASGGFNPLVGRKEFTSSKGDLRIDCEKRLSTDDCTISFSTAN